MEKSEETIRIVGYLTAVNHCINQQPNLEGVPLPFHIHATIRKTTKELEAIKEILEQELIGTPFEV